VRGARRYGAGPRRTAPIGVEDGLPGPPPRPPAAPERLRRLRPSPPKDREDVDAEDGQLRPSEIRLEGSAPKASTRPWCPPADASSRPAAAVTPREPWWVEGAWVCTMTASSEQRPSGYGRQTTLEEQTAQANTAPAGSQFTDPFRARSLAGARQPGEQRRGRDRRDRGPQRDARAVEQTPDGTFAQAKGARHLLVAVSGDGGSEDDLALHRRQRGDAPERFPGGQSTIEGRFVGCCSPRSRAGYAIGLGHELEVLACGLAYDVDGGVVHDAEKP
jgi:hypothetical protein